MDKQLLQLSYKLGYQQAIADTTAFLLNIPPRHEGTPLFGQKSYEEEYEQHIKDAEVKAKIRAEQLFEFGEGPKEDE